MVKSPSLKRGRPGELHVGTGFDEMLKQLADLFETHAWAFSLQGVGAINAESLRKMAQEQEADARLDHESEARRHSEHEAVMKRSGERGAIFAAALAFARTAARRNRDLLRVLAGLKIRTGTRGSKTSTVANSAPAGSQTA